MDASAYLHPHAHYATTPFGLQASSMLRYPTPMFIPQMPPMTTFPSVVPTPPPGDPRLSGQSSVTFPPVVQSPPPQLTLTSTYPGPSVGLSPKRPDSRSAGTPRYARTYHK